MKKASAIITRELGMPAIVGTENASTILTNGEPATASCTEGDTGYVYQGFLDFEHTKTQIDTLAKIPVKIMLNIGNSTHLHKIRSERKSNSHYIALSQCKKKFVAHKICLTLIRLPLLILANF